MSHAAAEPSHFAPYRPPEHDEDRAPRLPNAGIISLIGLLITIVSFSVAIGRSANALDQKVDKAELEKRLGEIGGDIRVIRSVLCSDRPDKCK